MNLLKLLAKVVYFVFLSVGLIIVLLLSSAFVAAILSTISTLVVYIGYIATTLLIVLMAVVISSGGLLAFRSYQQGFLAFRKYQQNASTPPGNWVLNVVRLFLRKKQISLVEEEIEDMRQEVYEALAEKRWLRARWLPVAYTIGLGWSALKWVVHEFAGVRGKVE
jgi:hypothetical protein